MSSVINPHKLKALVLGPVLAIVVYLLLPDTYNDANNVQTVFTDSAKVIVAIAIWMIVWWIFEAVHIAVVGLLPLLLFPLLTPSEIKTIAQAYSSPVIFLLLGGFLIGLSLQRWGVDKRIALLILSNIGSQPRNLILGFMLLCAILSAFISNSATAAMMVPIALTIIALLEKQSQADGSNLQHNFAIGMMLGIAYACNIGGIATIVGTPPNAFIVAFADDMMGHEISFADWSIAVLPIVLVLLPLTWLLLTRFIFPISNQAIAGGRELLHKQYTQLPPLARGGKITLAVFMLAITLWLSRTHIAALSFVTDSGTIKPFAGLSDASIALLAAILLFVLPANKKQPTLDWETAQRLPWHIIFLFGGGLALAQAVKTYEVDVIIGGQLTVLAGLPDILTLSVIVALVVFLTEITSNTATTAALAPIISTLAITLGIDPILAITATAISASCAFMMPIATLPNAIVFGSGYLKIKDMIKAGLIINLFAIVVLSLVIHFWSNRIL